MTGCIVGWAHLPFGKHDAETVESLVTRAARGALDHAGVDAADIDDIFLGHFNAGFSPQDFTAALVLQADDALRFKRATRYENACATGSAAVHAALTAIEAKRARLTLGQGVDAEIGADQILERPMEVHSRIQPDEDRPEPDSRAIHEHEFAGHR